MKKILQAIFLTFVLLASFVAFFPKEKLYYFLQESLSPYSVKVEARSVDANAFSLDLHNVSVMLAGSQVARVKSLHLSLLGLNLDGIKTAGMFADEVPDIKSLSITFGIESSGVATGRFGKMLAKVDIFQKEIVATAEINANVRNRYGMIFSQFKKVGDKYVYKYNF